MSLPRELWSVLQAAMVEPLFLPKGSIRAIAFLLTVWGWLRGWIDMEHAYNVALVAAAWAFYFGQKIPTWFAGVTGQGGKP